MMQNSRLKRRAKQNQLAEVIEEEDEDRKEDDEKDDLELIQQSDEDEFFDQTIFLIS